VGGFDPAVLCVEGQANASGLCPPWDQPPAPRGALAARRPARPRPQVTLQGESAQFVDPAQIPSAADVARLGQALAAGRRGDLHELMALAAAYTGLRQGELFALTMGQVDPAARVIDVDRKVIEVAGQLHTGAPKGRKRRKTIYPARTPHGYPLADKIAARI
jgi:integrase